MADYPISKEAVVQMLIDLRNNLGNERYISIGITMALGKLDGFPPVGAVPAGAVPVVRCRECKHRDSSYCPMHHENYACDADDYTEDDGFCHCGEKLDATDNNVGHKDAKDTNVPTNDGGAADV